METLANRESQSSIPLQLDSQKQSLVPINEQATQMWKQIVGTTPKAPTVPSDQINMIKCPCGDNQV
jgi:hypothetical protein